MVTSRQISAASMTMMEAVESVRMRGTRAPPRTVVAAANQVSCSRSSPEDRKNRMTTASAHTASAAGSANRIPANGPGRYTWYKETNGCDQARVAPTIAWMSPQAKIAARSQATGRQRGPGSRPSGNSSSVIPRIVQGRKPVTQYSHMTRWPAGSDPGAAISARTP